MLPTGGDGDSKIKYGGGGTWQVISNNKTTTVFSDSALSSSVDITCPGGMVQYLTYFKAPVQGQSCQMTASIFLSGAGGLLASQQAQMNRPQMRPGSVLGLMLYSENANFTAIGNQVFASGALTASVTIDNVNTSFSLVCVPTGSTFLITQAKDLTQFSASQRIGVSLTASAGYGSDHLTFSASWLAQVMVEV